MKIIQTSSECEPEVTKEESLNSQIEKFFATGKTITKINRGHRAVPEFTWWKQEYPKNWRQEYKK
tara:strand:- start:97 stop:291 length:195 start_codon:yes stop_codon:yes gene_type:complete